MKKIKITTPENIEVEYTLAGLGSRAAAAVIDMGIQMILYVILGIAIYMIAAYSTWFEEYFGWVIGISLLIIAMISYGYYIAMELNMNGMTPGKKVMKLRTIRNNGEPISLKHSVIRNLFRVVIDTFGVGMALIFFTKQNKRLGDLAASTIVVMEDRKTQPITLDSLVENNDRLSYYLNDEEYELLRSYFDRRDEMEDSSKLREELKLYFTKKFEALEILEEWKTFIDRI